tara:strand:+ start:161 stop:373 length:213 start_codon:yes stop_codon:yes gene_type:complete
MPAKAEKAEVLKVAEVDMPTPKKTKKVTRKGILNQVRNMKRAEGTENEWGGHARAKLKAKAATIGIDVQF